MQPTLRPDTWNLDLRTHNSGHSTPRPFPLASNPRPCDVTPSRRHPAGFTLLEVIVALAVLAIGIVTVLELFAGSLRLGAKASRYTQATIYAQNVMDRLFGQSTLEDGEDSGNFPGGYVWRARIREVPPEEEDERASTGLQRHRQRLLEFFHLKELEVTVSWQERGTQAVVLRSLRTVVEQPSDTENNAG